MSNWNHTREAYRDAQEMEQNSILAREERREIQRERMLDDSLIDAYERTDRDARHFDEEL